MAVRLRGTSKEDVLREVSMFGSCTKNELKVIASIADEVDVPAGYVLTHEGSGGREFFVIAQGEALVSLRGEEIARLGPGEFFGEMALLDRGPRTATVVAQTPMRLFVVDGRSFGALMESAPPVARAVMQGMAERLRVAQDSPTW